MNPPRPSFGLFHSLLKLIEVSRPSDRLFLRIFFFVMLFSGVWFLLAVNNNFSNPTPISGGTLKEGIVGTPRFANPALAITRADQDIIALIYSGVLKIDENGALTPDLAESVTVSEDGLTYNIIVKKGLSFHDDTPLTARDIAFTYELIQNSDLKSPLRGNWADVSVEQVNEYELNIVLKDAYTPFMENFLVGILPAHLWVDIPIEQLPFSQLNTEPIGSGPFALKTALRDQSGLIEAYVLEKNESNGRAPHMETLELHFFTEEDSLLKSLERGEVDATAYISNEHLAKLSEDTNYQIVSEPLPRIFGVFLNQNKSAAFRDEAVRKALNTATNRTKLIDSALHGYGVPITGPMISSLLALESKDDSPEVVTAASSSDAAMILDQAGWRKNSLGLLEKQIDDTAETLSFTLRTSNATLFTEVSEQLVEDWKAVGVDVAIEQFEQTDLLQSVIRPRDFEALLFGIDMSRSGDLYPFWHSSQKDDPGLNIAQYTNLTVDTALETARTEKDETARVAALTEAHTLIENEHPAIFLFQPKMSYMVKKSVVTGPMKSIARPSDRFSNIEAWYTSSDTLWNVFKNQSE